MKKLPLLGILLILSLIIVPQANAWIIENHPVLSDQALAQTQSSLITQDIMPYKDYFHVCNELTDFSLGNYFDVREDPDDSFWDKTFKTFTFQIGRKYTATHKQNACLRAVSIAKTPQENACAYGICAHHMQDTVPHNLAVPQVIKKSNLWNGLIHSPKEIYDKNIFTTEADRVYSRQILELGYEMTPFFEEVFNEDPAFSLDADVAGMIDWFITQVKPDQGYQLGFRGFFALPTYIYWVILILFLLSMSLLTFSVKKIRKGEGNISVGFTTFISVVLAGLSLTMIVGLATGTIWSMWEKLSQFLFSPPMYAVGALFLIIGISLVFIFFRTKEKLKNLSTIFVAGFILMIGVFCMGLPTTLELGNEQQMQDLSVENTITLLNEGVSSIRLIQDPAGYVALKEAEEAGRSARSVFMVTLISLLLAILFFTFKDFKKKKKR